MRKISMWVGVWRLLTVIGIGALLAIGCNTSPEQPENSSEDKLRTMSWTRCATEQQICSFDDTSWVRYGANNRYVYKHQKHSISCSNEAFGRDPVPNTTKNCEALTTWKRCAAEGQICRFNGTREVRYGAKNQFATESALGKISCDNEAFGGDPADGTAKTCEFNGVNADTATTSWVLCAKNNQDCAFEGLRDVRFGKPGKYVVKEAYRHAGACRASTFGQSENDDRMRCWYASAIKTKTLFNSKPGMGGLESYIRAPLGHPGFSEPRVHATGDKGGLGGDVGAFRVPCDLSHFAFDDPIVFPNKPGASHLHMFFGNTGTNAFSTADSIARTGRSTCGGGILNRSAYWVPALIDGHGQVVLPTDAIFYYKSGYYGVKPADIQAMPAGLRMISGDTSSTEGRPQWSCNEVYVGHKASIQEVLDDGRCVAGHRLQLSFDFPQCWDGKNLDSSDHKSHMSYPVAGGCPTTHPVAIPVITFNVMFPIPAGGAYRWHLSSDMYDYVSKGGGRSAHGDWWNGWDKNIENTWIKNCVAAGTDCHGYLLGDGRTLF